MILKKNDLKNVGYQVRNQIWQQVETQFEYQIRDQDWRQVTNQVQNIRIWTQVWRRVDNQIIVKLNNHDDS